MQCEPQNAVSAIDAGDSKLESSEALTEREKGYKSLFENMLEGFAYCRMLLDEEGKPIDFVYLQVNDAFENLTGLKREDVVQKKASVATPALIKDNPELLQICGRASLTRKKEKFEAYFKPVNAWFSVSVFSPRKGFFDAIFEDITEVKKTEAALRNRLEHFRALADSLPEVVFETDLTGKLTYVNKKAFELMGYTQEEFDKGVRNLDFIAEEDIARAKTNFARSMMTSTPTSNEYKLVRKDGSKFPALIEGIPIKFGNHTVGMRGLVIDLTENKRAMEKLAFQARLLDSAEQAIIAMDMNRVIKYWSHGAAKIYGWSEEETIGRNVDEVVCTTYSQDELADISKRLEAGENWTSETQVKRRDGSELPVIVNRGPIKNETGKVVGFISVATDISDQKALAYELAGFVDALSLSTEKIKELNDKLRVVGGLTRHDIRNKLAAIDGYVYLLRKRLRENPEGLQLVGEVSKASKQVLDIVEFERIYEQVGSEELTYVDVGKFVSEAAALVTDFRGITLRPDCGGLEVLADSLLRQVMYNLIDNTLKYGEKTTQIRVHFKEESGQLLLVYEDDGVGVNDDVRKHLFEKGFGKGTGFGLYTIKRIIDAYGWTLEENGEHGKGVRFTFRVPAGHYRFVGRQTSTDTP